MSFVPVIQTAPAATTAMVLPAQSRPKTMAETLRRHLPEYAIEAWTLGTFMISACSFGVLLGYPRSPVLRSIHSVMLRSALGGLAMGLTALSLIYSPWGKRSGAHMNPAVTLSFLRLGKIRPADALFYICAQFVGGALGVGVAAMLYGEALGYPAVNYVATMPGTRGPAVAFVAELVISALLMTVVLNASSRPALERYTGLFAGMLVALYITFEAPLSGMSMNAARTFGSAVWARQWTAFWVYLIAPLTGMLLATEIHVRRAARTGCAKLHHANSQRCIFCGANGGF